MQNNKVKILIFAFDKPSFALYLSSIECFVHDVQITLLPKAPRIVQGVINFHGSFIPVMDIRRCFGLTPGKTDLEDHFIIVRTAKRVAALIINSVVCMTEIKSNRFARTETDLPYAQYISESIITEDNLLLITDLEKFLSLDEDEMLEKAMGKINAHNSLV